MSQSGLTQTGRTVKQYVVQRLAPALGGSDGYVQVIFNPLLSDKVFQTAWSEVEVKRCVIGAGFT